MVLKETDFCFLLIQYIEVDPKEKQHPDVLFRSTTLLAQSASEYPCSLKTVPKSVSQSIVDCAPEISQDIPDNNPMNVMRLNHKLTQRVQNEAYVRTGVY